MFKLGYIAYFTKAKKSTSRKCPVEMFKGHGVGVYIGHIPLGGRDLSAKHIIPLFGQLGFISFDDLVEFLGEKETKEIILKFETKYGSKKDEKQPELPLEEAQPEEGKIIEIKKPTNIIGINGKPLTGEIKNESC